MKSVENFTGQVDHLAYTEQNIVIIKNHICQIIVILSLHSTPLDQKSHLEMAKSRGPG